MKNSSSFSLSIEKEETGTPSDSVYERIRHDILSDVFKANSRLKVSELARLYETSTNPIREALQQLRGEGLVIFAPNQGARVRPIDMDYVRNVAEVGYLLEPYLMLHFIETASTDDIRKLETIQEQIEALNFTDVHLHTNLNHQFHEFMYEHHYNQVAFKLWKQHREIIGSISARIPIALSRREAILNEHRALIAAIHSQDTEGALNVLKLHIGDAGQYLVDQLRIKQARDARNRSN
ncbi:GntR family transcriptional regulator [Marinomonas sp. TI.3.20]|uniref:GntR family transcriptional regulator n=1 Tax=Marinomonas sp. TI.3.20 TaxID=3121296 RepID=UPI00311F35E5